MRKGVIEVKEGQVYNEFTVIKPINKPNTDKYSSINTDNWVECRCSCGNIVQIPTAILVRGKLKSCGHLRTQKGMENFNKGLLKKRGVEFTFKDQTHNLKDWSRITGISYSTIKWRYMRGMPPNKILEGWNG